MNRDEKRFLVWQAERGPATWLRDHDHDLTDPDLKAIAEKMREVMDVIDTVRRGL